MRITVVNHRSGEVLEVVEFDPTNTDDRDLMFTYLCYSADCFGDGSVWHVSPYGQNCSVQFDANGIVK